MTIRDITLLQRYIGERELTLPIYKNKQGNKIKHKKIRWVPTYNLSKSISFLFYTFSNFRAFIFFLVFTKVKNTTRLKRN